MPSFVLGRVSLGTLRGVHPALAAVVHTAITLTSQDFIVYEGVRTPARQREYYARGVTRTLNSMHMLQPDGTGHAVDLVPWIDGTARWEWPPIYLIADAMRAAVRQQSPVPRIVWGGVWDRGLADMLGDIRSHVSAYCARHPGPDFIDGPHFEIHT